MPCNYNNCGFSCNVREDCSIISVLLTLRKMKVPWFISKISSKQSWIFIAHPWGMNLPMILWDLRNGMSCSKCGFGVARVSGWRIVLLLGADWAHCASKMANSGCISSTLHLQCFRAQEGMLPPSACRIPRENRGLHWCGVFASKKCQFSGYFPIVSRERLFKFSAYKMGGLNETI